MVIATYTDAMTKIEKNPGEDTATMYMRVAPIVAAEQAAVRAECAAALVRLSAIRAATSKG